MLWHSVQPAGMPCPPDLGARSDPAERGIAIPGSRATRDRRTLAPAPAPFAAPAGPPPGWPRIPVAAALCPVPGRARRPSGDRGRPDRAQAPGPLALSAGAARTDRSRLAGSPRRAGLSLPAGPAPGRARPQRRAPPPQPAAPVPARRDQRRGQAGGLADVDMESAQAEARQQALETLDPACTILRLGLYLTVFAADPAAAGGLHRARLLALLGRAWAP